MLANLAFNSFSIAKFLKKSVILDNIVNNNNLCRSTDGINIFLYLCNVLINEKTEMNEQIVYKIVNIAISEFHKHNLENENFHLAFEILCNYSLQYISISLDILNLIDLKFFSSLFEISNESLQKKCLILLGASKLSQEIITSNDVFFYQINKSLIKLLSTLTDNDLIFLILCFFCDFLTRCTNKDAFYLMDEKLYDLIILKSLIDTSTENSKSSLLIITSLFQLCCKNSEYLMKFILNGLIENVATLLDNSDKDFQYCGLIILYDLIPCLNHNLDQKKSVIKKIEIQGIPSILEVKEFTHMSVEFSDLYTKVKDLIEENLSK